LARIKGCGRDRSRTDRGHPVRNRSRRAAAASIPEFGIGNIIGIGGRVVCSRADAVVNPGRQTPVMRPTSVLPPPLPSKPPAPLTREGTYEQGDTWVPLIGSVIYICRVRVVVPVVNAGAAFSSKPRGTSCGDLAGGPGWNYRPRVGPRI
jgi:hypothetical protein